MLKFLWKHHRELIRSTMNTDMGILSRSLLGVLLQLIPIFTALIYTVQASLPYFKIDFGRQLGTIFSAFILGPFVVFLLAFFLKITGRWFGGKGTWNQLRVALAWAQIPHLLTWLLGFGIMYLKVTQSGALGMVFTILWYLFYLVPLSATVLTVVYLVVGVSEVHQLSPGRSFATLVIANFFFVLSSAALVFAFFLFGMPLIAQYVQ